jgi:hypothetical protein
LKTTERDRSDKKEAVKLCSSSVLLKIGSDRPRRSTAPNIVKKTTPNNLETHTHDLLFRSLSGVGCGFEPHPTHSFSSMVELDTITLGSNLIEQPSWRVMTVTKPIFNSLFRI